MKADKGIRKKFERLSSELREETRVAELKEQVEYLREKHKKKLKDIRYKWTYFPSRDEKELKALRAKVKRKIKWHKNIEGLTGPQKRLANLRVKHKKKLALWRRKNTPKRLSDEKRKELESAARTKRNNKAKTKKRLAAEFRKNLIGEWYEEALKDYKPKPKDELKRFAMRVLRRDVFTSLELMGKDNPIAPWEILLTLGGENLRHSLLAITFNSGIIWSEMNDAAPMSINGLPRFFTANIISPDDAKTVVSYLKKFMAVMEED